MMQDVIITIRSAQRTDPEGEDSIEFTTDGFYSYGDDSICMSYMESEVTGLTGTRTSVTVLPDMVSVDRDGMITSRMVFMEGEKVSFQYGTPYGTATLSFDTRSIRKSFDADGGELEIDYVVDVEHTIVSQNLFKLTVKKIKTGGN